MKKIGLTGNIGSGKTFVCKVFEALGIPVYYADLKARNILNSPEVIREIALVFGLSVVVDNNEIDRKKLGDIVFADKGELEKLNQIIHPKLRADFVKWVENHQQSPYVLQEAAILFENGFDKMMDETICVSAPKELRLQRVMSRDHAQEKEVLARMKSQWSDKKKENLADYIIVNNGIEMILPQILEIHQKIIQ